jgi:hypothetical protein
MFVTLMLILLAIASGTLLTYLYDVDARFFARLCAGTCVGFALLGLVAFYYALFLGLTSLNVILTSATLACAFLLLILPAIRFRLSGDIRSATHLLREVTLHPRRHGRVICLAGLYVLIAIMLQCFVSRAVFERDGAILTGAINNMGDLPLHTSMISSFAYGENFPPEHSQFAGARLTYPFLVDFLSAVFMHTGVNLTNAMYLQTIFLMLALVALVYRWAFKLTRDTIAAVTSSGLLFFSGGLGWWLLLDDVRRASGRWLAALMHLSHEYTTETFYGLRWGNMLEAILLPQRSFQLGLPLSIIVLILCWQAMEAVPTSGGGETAERSSPAFFGFFLLPSSSIRRMLGAGAVTGLLPLVHTTTFGVMMGMAACLTLLFRRWKLWGAFFAAALLVAMPQVWWFGHGSSVEPRSLFAWQIGWDKGSANFWWFWFKNTGLFIPALVVALVWGLWTRSMCRRFLLFYLPFLLCFIVPNLFRLMPWIWDNIKALIYWYIASVPLVALLLTRLWRAGIVYRAAAVTLFVSMTLAGALDVWRVLAKSEWVEFDQAAIKCANMIIKTTPPRALVLHAPINNHAVYLTGRRSLFSIAFMAWVHGLNLAAREGEIQRIYSGAPDAVDLIAKYKIDYAVVGPAERARLPVNESFFSRYPMIGEADGYKLYRTAGE